ncbi:MAG: SdrD B-like domain-containing protein [Chloroflexota bacterium]
MGRGYQGINRQQWQWVRWAISLMLVLTTVVPLSPFEEQEVTEGKQTIWAQFPSQATVVQAVLNHEPDFAPDTPNTPDAPTAIMGTVFRDLDSDGANDVDESGVSGITVTVYDDSGVSVGNTTTIADGTYSLTPSDSGPYRVEFTGLPSYLQPGVQGANNETTVQFVADGDASSIDLAVQNPTDFCQADPDIALSCYENGAITGNTNAAYVQIPYTASGIPAKDGGSGPNPQAVASIAQIGAVWGADLHRETQAIYTTAVLKRHVAVGPAGLGGVYAINVGASTVTSFTLQGVSPSNGGAALDFGSVTRTTTTGAIDSGTSGDYQLSTDPIQANVDLDAFGKVGKAGFGDADFDHTGTRFWTLNLNSGEQAIISVDLHDTSAVPTDGSAISGALVNRYLLSGLTNIPTCTNGVFRPWALAFHDGAGYVGGVCSAENSGTSANLEAHILSFDPDNVVNGFSTELSFDLDFGREHKSNFGGHQEDSDWMPWRDNWNDVSLNTTHKGFIAESAPMLTDIDFNSQGDMVLGFADRYGMQAGFEQYPAISGVAGTNNFNDVETGGDIVHVCRVGGVWVMENSNATCLVTDPGHSINTNSTTDGPSGNGEYYHEDLFRIGAASSQGHNEVTSGGLIIVPQTDDVVTTAMDPIGGTLDNANSQGIIKFDTLTGDRENGYIIVYDNGTLQGKAGGLGDPVAMCQAAPVEIGNRVWVDTNRNGIQDPSEGGISDVTVRLYDMDNSGALVGSAVTDSGGNYVFGGLNDTNISSGSLLANNNYELRIDLADSNLNVNSVTIQNANSISTNDHKTDLADSDADDTTHMGFATIAFSTSNAGENNHTLDFGFGNDLVDLRIEKTAHLTSIETGQNLLYTLTVTNIGMITATNVTVTDTLPAEVTPVGATPTQGECSGTSTVICGVGSIAPSATVNIQLTVTVNSIPAVLARRDTSAIHHRIPVAERSASLPTHQPQTPSPMSAKAGRARLASPAFVTESTATATSNTTSMGISIPGGLTDGDLLLAAIVVDGNVGSITAPAGWQSVDSGHSGSAVTMAVFYRIVNGDSGTATFSWSGNEQAAGSIRHYTGTDTVNPIHGSAAGTGTSNSPAAPSVTATVGDTTIVRFFGMDRDGGNSINFGGSGLSNTYNVRTSSAGDAASYAVGDAIQSAVGSTGTSTIGGINEEWRAVTVVLQEPQGGSLVIVKNTVGADGTFDFTSNDLGSGALNGGGFQLTTTVNTASTTFDGLVAGTYHVTETVPAGWSLTGASCSNGDNLSSISVSVGQTVTCTFTNTDVRGSIVVVEQTDVGDAAFDFTSNDLGSGSLGSGSFQLTTNGGTASVTYDSLVPGTYHVAEAVPADWSLANASCSGGSDPSSIALGNNETVTCTFMNTFSPCSSGQLFNVATVASDEAETVTTNNLGHSCVNVTEPVGTASLAVEKLLNTPDPVMPGQTVTFTIRITNTGTTTITTLPLTDTYSTAYLNFVGLRTTPQADTTANNGQILWSDLTQIVPNGFGQDFGPSDVWDVTVEFVAALDTSSLPDSATINTVQVYTHTVTDTVRIFNPTNIVLVNREVNHENDMVVLSWSTVDETALIGFHVLRLDIREDGTVSEPVRLTSDAQMILAQGSANGADYRYEIEMSDMNANHHYILEMVMADGTYPLMDMGRVNQQRAGWTVYLPILQK